MEAKESLELFNKHAFRKAKPRGDFNVMGNNTKNILENATDIISPNLQESMRSNY